MLTSRHRAPDVKMLPVDDGFDARAQRLTQAPRLSRVFGYVAIVGVALSVSLALVARSVNEHHEHSLLVVQSRQAAAVLSATILSITDPLSTALHVETATDGNISQFDSVMSPYVGPKALFAFSELWKVSGRALRKIAAVGSPAPPTAQSGKAYTLAERALHIPTFVVTSIRAGKDNRVGYAIGDPSDPLYVVYAERAIPADRRVPVETGSAFSNLDFATYLGSTQSNSALETTDVAPSQLPLTGDVARASIAFGDSSITLVAKPSRPLGGTAGADLGLACLVGGVLLTLAIAVAADQLIRRRQDAEAQATTTRGLYERLDGLYAEQRTIAETLQRALLPQRLPSLLNLEIAAHYISGSEGVEIGGDWYSVVAIDERRFALVIGDVSGKGIGAATTMARLRFTIQAYLMEGHSPGAVLEMASRQLDLRADDHFATVLVVVGDSVSGQLLLASAGHLDPLIVSADRSEQLVTKRGVPLGLGPQSYEDVTFQLAPGSTLLVFTDGLIERRGESLDAGLERLRAATGTVEPTLDSWLRSVVTRLATGMHRDDIAALAVTWKRSEP